MLHRLIQFHVKGETSDEIDKTCRDLLVLLEARFRDKISEQGMDVFTLLVKEQWGIRPDLETFLSEPSGTVTRINKEYAEEHGLIKKGKPLFPRY